MVHPNYIIGILLSYLLGSIPTGYLMGRILKGVDVRQYGSGNVGATNVVRVVGKGPGIATLILDILKGLIAVIVVPLLVYKSGAIRPDLLKISCTLAVIAGHNWTVFLKFRGGKGVATTAGAFIGLVPAVFLSALLVWLIVLILSKYVSLSSITAAVFLPIFLIIYKEPTSYQILGVIVAIIGILRHKENIKRLLAGEEHKFSWKRKSI